MAIEIPKRIGKYDILEELGRGGMGAVYKGVEPSTQKLVAIKVVSEELHDETNLERFRREAAAVALLQHPNVVRMIELSEEEDSPYFVMEYVQGTSLDSILQRRRLSLTEAISVFKEVCKGLKAADAKEIVHRDLNPRNILVSEDLSVVKLADFGISRVESVSKAEGTLSTGSIAMGTLHYMAPEQSSGMDRVDHRADIYSLGVLLYEMLTGRVPVGRFNLPSQLEENLPPEIDPVVLRCLDAEPSGRFPSVDRLLDAVAKLEDQLRLSFAQDFKGLSRSTSRLVSRSTTSLKRRSVRWGLILGALVVGAGLLVALWSFMGDRAGTPVLVESSPPVEEPAELEASEGAQMADMPPAAVPDIEEEPPAEGDDSSAAPVEAAPTVATSPPAAPVEVPEMDIGAALAAAAAKADAGLVDQAIEDFDALIASGRREAAAPALLQRGLWQTQGGDEEAAMASFIELETRYPEAASTQEGLYRLGLLQRGRGRSQWQAARDTFGRLEATHPGSRWLPAALRQRADLEKELKLRAQDERLGRRVPAALVTLRTLVERFATDRATEDGAMELAELYEIENLPAEAAAAYALLAENFPKNDHDAWWKAGQMYEKADDPERALAAYEKVPDSSRRSGAAKRRIRRLS